MESQFWRQSIAFLKRKRKKLHQTTCYITVDETYDSYTGKLHKKALSELTDQEKKARRYIHKYKPKKGDTGSFKYLIFALVYGKKRRVLRVKALKRKERYTYFIVETLKELYQEVKFECALLDRGFYIAELVDTLQKEKIPFVIRARLCKKMKSIFGIYGEWKTHSYAIDDWAETRLVLGRDIKGRPWGFVTNICFEKPNDLLFVYKKRWNIENIFKATDGIQLRAATSSPIIRMFCVCLSFLIYNAWQRMNKKPTLLDYVKHLLETLFIIVRKISRVRDKLILNIPFWNFVQL